MSASPQSNDLRNRVIFTMYLSNENINTTSIPEFDDAIKAFESAGKAFTLFSQTSFLLYSLYPLLYPTHQLP